MSLRTSSLSDLLSRCMTCHAMKFRLTRFFFNNTIFSDLFRWNIWNCVLSPCNETGEGRCAKSESLLPLIMLSTWLCRGLAPINGDSRCGVLAGEWLTSFNIILCILPPSLSLKGVWDRILVACARACSSSNSVSVFCTWLEMRCSCNSFSSNAICWACSFNLATRVSLLGSCCSWCSSSSSETKSYPWHSRKKVAFVVLLSLLFIFGLDCDFVGYCMLYQASSAAICNSFCFRICNVVSTIFSLREQLATWHHTLKACIRNLWKRIACTFDVALVMCCTYKFSMCQRRIDTTQHRTARWRMKMPCRRNRLIWTSTIRLQPYMQERRWALEVRRITFCKQQ